VNGDGGVERITVRQSSRSSRNGRTSRREALKGILPIDVVDVAAGVIVVAHEANRRVLRERNIHEAFERATGVTGFPLGGLDIVAGLKRGGFGLVGDDRYGAGEGAGAIERALRTCQRLDSRDVIDMNVQVTADGGDRYVIDVHGGGGEISGVQLRRAV